MAAHEPVGAPRQLCPSGAEIGGDENVACDDPPVVIASHVNRRTRKRRTLFGR